MGGLQDLAVLQPADREAPGLLSRPWLRAAFVLSCWWATAPRWGWPRMHTWKPDAYGEAPGVVGALLAGGADQLRLPGPAAGLPDRAPPPARLPFARELLVGMGLLSMACRRRVHGAPARLQTHAGLFQRRAHGHPGASASGIGGPRLFGALLHMVNNGLTKGVLFLSAGNIHRAYGSKSRATTSAGRIRRTARSRAALFLAGLPGHHRLAAVRPVHQRVHHRRRRLGPGGPAGPRAAFLVLLAWSSSAWRRPCCRWCWATPPAEAGRARRTGTPWLTVAPLLCCLAPGPAAGPVAARAPGRPAARAAAILEVHCHDASTLFDPVRNGQALPLAGAFRISRSASSAPRSCGGVRPGACAWSCLFGARRRRARTSTPCWPRTATGCWTLGAPGSRAPRFPSLTPECPQAHLFEREMAEQFGLDSRGPSLAQAGPLPPVLAAGAATPGATDRSPSGRA